MSVLEYTSQLFVFNSKCVNPEEAPSRSVLQWIFYLFSRVFGCWHRNMSRPFTREGRSYCVCLRCGMRRAFNLENWKMKGPYYFPNDLSNPRDEGLTLASVKSVATIKHDKSPKPIITAMTIRSWYSTTKERKQ